MANGISVLENREREMQWLLSSRSRGGKSNDRKSNVALRVVAEVPAAPGGFDDDSWKRVAGCIRPSPCVEYWIEVTPDLAEEWLLHRNTNNRRIRRGRAASIAADIKNGRFKQTHQGVAFSAEGVLLDGQHRLAAIVLAEVSVLLRVSFGLDKSTIRNIDADMGPRNPGDVLTLLGHDNGSERAAIARAIILLETGNSRGSSALRETTMERHRVGIDAMLRFASRRQLRAPFAAALAYAYPIAPAKVAELAQSVTTQIGLQPNTPALSLNNTIRSYSSKASGDGGWVLLMHKTLRCAEMHLAGKPLNHVRDGDAGFQFFRDARKKAGLD